MKFYVFNSDFQIIDRLEDAGFTGNLFVYGTHQSDFFTKIVKDIDVHHKIKYMVAIRPYVISPEYLGMIHNSIASLAQNDSRLEINLISGHIKPDEENVIRTLGAVNNNSSQMDRSEYLIEYVDMLSTLPKASRPNFYVSVTNKFTLEAARRNNAKAIIGYSSYVKDIYDIDYKKTMVAITPVLRKTQEELDKLKEYNIRHKSDLKTFTYHQLTELVNSLKKDGIEELIFSFWNDEDKEEIINFVKEYNSRKTHR